MHTDTTRRIAMAVTAAAMIGGALYQLLAPHTAAAAMPIDGALSPAPSHEAYLATVIVWILAVLAAGFYMHVGLWFHTGVRDDDSEQLRPIILLLYWFTIVFALVPAALMAMHAPIDAMRPMFYIPIVMVAGTLVLAYIQSWRLERGQPGGNR